MQHIAILWEKKMDWFIVKHKMGKSPNFLVWNSKFTFRGFGWANTRFNWECENTELLNVIPQWGYPPWKSTLRDHFNWKIVIAIPPSQTLIFLQKCWQLPNEFKSKSLSRWLNEFQKIESWLFPMFCPKTVLELTSSSYPIPWFTDMRGSGFLQTALDLSQDYKQVNLSINMFAKISQQNKGSVNHWES